MISSLVQNKSSRSALAVGLKGDLCIDHFEEKIVIAFGIDFDFVLTRGLCEEAVSFPASRQTLGAAAGEGPQSLVRGPS